MNIVLAMPLTAWASFPLKMDMPAISNVKIEVTLSAKRKLIVPESFDVQLPCGLDGKYSMVLLSRAADSESRPELESVGIGRFAWIICLEPTPVNRRYFWPDGYASSRKHDSRKKRMTVWR